MPKATGMTISQHAELAADNEKNDNKTIFGFWLYIMTDCVLFASLFATYAVLHSNTFGGPGGKDLFEPKSVLVETLALLVSSFTCGLAMVAARKKQKTAALVWLGVTFLLGVIFLGIEINEFASLIGEGHGWGQSGFLSSFFVLVGTHGLHITVGLSWLVALHIKVIKSGFTRGTRRHLAMFSYFWHFLDVVWIFIFTAVYMIGVNS